MNEVVWNGQSDAILMAAGRQSATYTEKGVVVRFSPLLFPSCISLADATLPLTRPRDLIKTEYKPHRIYLGSKFDASCAGRGACRRRRNGASKPRRGHGAHGQLHVHRSPCPHKVPARPALPPSRLLHVERRSGEADGGIWVRRVGRSRRDLGRGRREHGASDGARCGSGGEDVGLLPLGHVWRRACARGCGGAGGGGAAQGVCDGVLRRDGVHLGRGGDDVPPPLLHFTRVSAPPPRPLPPRAL